jgi:uncharacterized membrane protein
MYRHFAQHKFRYLTLILLVVASATAVALVVARTLYTHTSLRTNLIKNLVLAWIPFVLAYISYVASAKRTLLYLIVPISALTWLIFFPNAPYLLTDLQHLGTNPGAVPLWFDVILFIWFAWIGLLLGVVSLYLMQEVVTRELGAVIGWIFVIVIAGMSSVGIYLGRFLRWNSWDVLQNPGEIARDLWQVLRDPMANAGSVGFTLLFTALFLFIYFTLYSFGHLLHEQREKPAG